MKPGCWCSGSATAAEEAALAEQMHAACGLEAVSIGHVRMRVRVRLKLLANMASWCGQCENVQQARRARERLREHSSHTDRLPDDDCSRYRRRDRPDRIRISVAPYLSPLIAAATIAVAGARMWFSAGVQQASQAQAAKI